MSILSQFTPNDSGADVRETLNGMLPGIGIRPSSPFRVIATAGAASGTIDVMWQHRQPVGLTSFIITSSSGAVVTVAANGRGQQSMQLTGLTNGTAQSVRVQAVSAAGTSVVSDASNIVTPTVLPSSILPVTRNLEFWWSARQVASPPADAADLLSAQFLDYSGNGYHGTVRTGNADTTTKIPKWKSNWSNGKPAVRFQGNGDRIEMSRALVPGMRGARATIIVIFSGDANPSISNKLSGRVISTEVSQATAVAVPNYGLATGTGYIKGNNRLALSAGGTAGQINPTAVYGTAGNGDGNTTNTSIIGPAIAFGIPAVAALVTGGQFYVNGSPVASALPVNPMIYDPNIAQQAAWTVGAEDNANGNYNFQGCIAEIAIYADTLTPTELANWQTYAAGAY